jgi:hypothetical protein
MEKGTRLGSGKSPFVQILQSLQTGTRILLGAAQCCLFQRDATPKRRYGQRHGQQAGFRNGKDSQRQSSPQKRELPEQQAAVHSAISMNIKAPFGFCTGAPVPSVKFTLHMTRMLAFRFKLSNKLDGTEVATFQHVVASRIGTE